MDHIRAFLRDEHGSAAVDWVVMTAAVVTLGLALMSVISDAIETAGLRLADQLSSMPIRTSFEEWDALRSELEAGSGAEDEDGG
jgi:Flp pilus assembly pilin Flp